MDHCTRQYDPDHRIAEPPPLNAKARGLTDAAIASHVRTQVVQAASDRRFLEHQIQPELTIKKMLVLHMQATRTGPTSGDACVKRWIGLVGTPKAYVDALSASSTPYSTMHPL